MANIAPSRTFEGSDLSTNVFGKIIKDGIRVVSFRDERNKEGNFFFILPPYKADSAGRGVSWKVVQVRDNFGIDVKEMFAVPKQCPVSYFAGRVKQFYPDYAKVEQANVNGRAIKRYPAFGRQTNKVIFNVAYMQSLHLGSHVLTLPQFGGAEHVEAWGRRRMADGSEAPLLNNPDAAIPVFIQLKKDAIGMPWVVAPDASKTYKLPPELSDSNYLYNLDDVVHYPEIDYLIDKMRSFVPTEIFNKCMAGYALPGGTVFGGGLTSSPAMASPASSTVAPPSYPTTTVSQPAQIAPVSSPMPRAMVPMTPQAQQEPPVPSLSTANAGNPTAGATPTFTVEQARAYLNQTGSR